MMKPGILAILLGFVLSASVSMHAVAQEAVVDPAAAKMLKQMTDHIGSLKQFSVHSQNTLEDVLESGQRIDEDISASVTISRPNKLRGERLGGLLNQQFYYDGKNLTLYNPSDKVYATESAPATIEGMLDFIHQSLGLIIPASDFIYPNAYALLMQDVTSAIVVGKSVINGNICNHLAFSRPAVDFQVWVAEKGEPLPCKYVVTDTSTAELLSISSVLSDWNFAPEINETTFSFAPAKGDLQIKFLPANTSNGSTSNNDSGASK